MTVESQHRATRPHEGDDPTEMLHRDDRPTDEIPHENGAGNHGEPQADGEPERDDEPQKTGADRPSGVQVAASALAAVTATALLSTLGVAGTLIGAALSSIITVFANYLYSSSLRRTAERVSAAPPLQKVRARTGAGTTAVLKVPADDAAATGRQTSTVALAVGQGDTATIVGQTVSGTADGATPTADLPTDAGWLDRLRAAWRAVVGRYGYRRIVVTALAFFAAVLAAVTLVELAAGKPLSHVVRNEEGTGTSLFGGRSVPDATVTEDPASDDSGTRTGTGTDRERGTEGDVTDPALPAPGEPQPGDSGDAVPEPTPSETTPEVGTDGTPSPSPSEPAAPEQSPVPEDQVPGDQATTGSGPVEPAPEVQQEVPAPSP